MTNLISIIMPVKDADPYLKECLNSIIHQTYQNWELIAVNDHSADNSVEIIQLFAKSDKRIHLFNNTKHGIIPALENALSNSKGEFITRMDADDIMPPQKLIKLKESLIESENSISIGLVKYFSEDKIFGGYKKYEEWLNKLTLQNSNISDIYKECVIPSPCWMMHKSDLIKFKLLESLSYPEDYHFCFKVYEKEITIITVKEILHFWRDYKSRTSRNSSHYQDQNYYDLKLEYFFKIDFIPKKTLVIWGAGNKGKGLIKNLGTHCGNFLWATENKNKQGKIIYDSRILDPLEINLASKNYQVIVAVSSPSEKDRIKNYLHDQKLLKNSDFFMFY